MSVLHEKLTVTSTPHIRGKITVDNIMKDVLIALAPAAIAGIYYFGPWALFLMVISVAACVMSEYLFQKLTKRTITVFDCSAAVTGLLLALNLPASSAWWMPVVGGVFAIIVVKQLFGGIGQNFFNPALAARAFLLISYPGRMVSWPAPERNLFGLGVDVVTEATAAVDAVSTATPLALLKSGTAPVTGDYINAFIGYTGGSLGETCAIALILGGLYLIIRKVISWRIPVAFIGSTFIMTAVFGRFGLFNGVPLYEILTGGLLLGAFFMATDYATSPVTAAGQLVMGAGCGVITAIIRVYGGYPEGVSFAILLMNVVSPMLDRYLRPRVFGTSKNKMGKAKTA